MRRRAERFDEVVEEGLAVVEGLDGDAFVAAVEADVGTIDEDALDAVSGNACYAEAAAVGGTHDHVGNNGDAGPHFCGDTSGGFENLGAEWRGGALHEVTALFDRDLVVGEDFLESILDVFGRVFGQNAAVDGGGGKLWQGVHGVATFEQGGDAGCAERRVEGGCESGDALHGVLRAAGDLQQILFFGAGGKFAHLTEVGRGDFVGFEGKIEISEASERACEMVDGIVLYRQRAVAAFVADFETEIHDVFFADLQIVGDMFSIDGFAPATFIETKFRVDQIAMILDEPVDAVERTAAFFIGGEGDDEVAVGNESFLFVLNQIGDPDGGLGFVVAGAAAIEVTVLFEELKGIDGPVFALGFNDVNMGKQEERLALAGAVIAHNEIELFGAGAIEEDVFVGKARGFEAGGGGFRDGRGGACREAGGNFDELFVDVAGELLFGVGAGGLC